MIENLDLTGAGAAVTLLLPENSLLKFCTVPGSAPGVFDAGAVGSGVSLTRATGCDL